MFAIDVVLGMLIIRPIFYSVLKDKIKKKYKLWKKYLRFSEI